MRTTTAVPLATLAAGAAGLAWSLVEARSYTLRHARIPVLPAGSGPLRVLHVSDLHLMPSQKAKIDWVRGLATLSPDLVVNTGDNLSHAAAVPGVLEAHRELLEFPGVFVLGSNDYFAPKPKNPARYLLPAGGNRRVLGQKLPTEELVRGFTDRGWVDLTNRRGSLKVGEHLLEFVGVDDPHIGRDRYSLVAGAPDAQATLTLGIVHAPYRRVLDHMVADGAGVVLAGHTHGGQLCLPGIGALVTNCDLPRSQAKGLSSWQSPDGRQAPLYVSAGLGTSPYTPVRFACRPEATMITLTAVDAPA